MKRTHHTASYDGASLFLVQSLLFIKSTQLFSLAGQNYRVLFFFGGGGGVGEELFHHYSNHYEIRPFSNKK